MSHKQEDTQFLHKAKTSLDQLSDKTPADVANSLQQARRDAIAGAPRADRGSWWRMTLPAGATAILLLAFLLPGNPTAPEHQALPQFSLETLDMLSAEEELELYEELEFILWLESQSEKS